MVNVLAVNCYSRGLIPAAHLPPRTAVVPNSTSFVLSKFVVNSIFKQAGLNFSQELQCALKARLNIGI